MERDFADFLGDVVVRQAQAVAQGLHAVGFFERRQVLALEVFNQRQFQRFAVVGVSSRCTGLPPGPPRARPGSGARRR